MLKIKIRRKTKSQLSKFPKFEYLGVHHQALINELTKTNSLYSDFNFISLWSWDHQQKLKLCQLNNNLVIRFQDYQNPEDYFYSFFGTNRVDDTALTLLGYSAKENQFELKLIPEFVIENIKDHSKFVMTEDRDNHDYIVAIKSMMVLEGSHNNNKRNALRQFMREHEQYLSVNELDLKSPEHRRDIRRVVEKWADQVPSKSSFNENELKAIDKLLNNHGHVVNGNLHVVGISLGDELKAFSIAEILENEFAMWHYKKADRDVKGLGVALDHLSAKSLDEKGVKNLNHEQDLGIEGLRIAKMKHDPVYFVKKYKLSLKNN